jgi:L-ascorbate 6-phosphate lactonase
VLIAIDALSAWDIDISFAPINGSDYFTTRRSIIGNTDLRETVELTETLDIGLIVLEGNTVDPGHFVSHLYYLNPMRPQKLLRPGELLYFVKDPDD